MQTYLNCENGEFKTDFSTFIFSCFVLLTIGGTPVGLVLVFAATRSQMALRSVS